MTPTRREALRLLASCSVATFLSQKVSGQAASPKGGVIRTVLKDLSPTELARGATLFHEHLSFSREFANRLSTMHFPGTPPSKLGPPAPKPDEKYFLEDLDVLAAELVAAKKEGVACVVDAGHADMGRSLPFLKRLSDRSGMPIVASTGYYGQPFYTPELAAMNENQIAQELVRQVTAAPIGAFGEIGTWDVKMSPDEKKVFRAVGKAHAVTNVPIFTHTAFGEGALEQLDVLESVGVRPQSIAIGHMGGLLDPKVEVHKAIAKRGAFLGFDRQGGDGDVNQVPLVVALIEAGYTDQLLFASDLAGPAQIKHNGGAGYAKTVTVFEPKLRQAGVKEETLHRILVDNSRRFLTFVPKQPRGQI